MSNVRLGNLFACSGTLEELPLQISSLFFCTNLSFYIAMKMKRSLKSIGRVMNSFCIMFRTSRRSFNVVWSGKIFTFFMRTNFVWPNDQTALLSVESSGEWSLWNRRSRQKWTCGWKMEDPTVASASETWCARMKKSVTRYIRYSPDASWTWRVNLEPHAVKYCVYQMCCLHHPSLTWESLLLVNENLEKKTIVLNAPRHCRSAILQYCGKLHSPLLLLTTMNWKITIRKQKIATNYSNLNLDRRGTQQDSLCMMYVDRLDLLWRWKLYLCCWNCCPGRCRIWRSGRIATLHWCPTSTAFFLVFQKNNNQWLWKIGSWLIWSCGVSLTVQTDRQCFLVSRSFPPCAKSVFSCQFVELLAKFFGPSCVNFWIATRFLDLESINHRCALLLRLFQSFFGLDRVLSYLLMHHAVLACHRPCKMYTKGLSERRTSPCSTLYFIQRK